MIDKTADARAGVLSEIKDRWSPRAFSDKPVSNEKLLNIFDAARWAASSRNEQPWRWMIARPGDSHYNAMFEVLDKWNKNWAKTAPVLAAAFVSKKFERNGKPNATAPHDLGLAMGNLSIQATYEGLHLHMMAGFDGEQLLAKFDIDDEKFDAVCMFAIGYQDFDRISELDEKYHESEKKKRSRKSLTDLISGSTFGEAPDWVK